MRLGVVVYVSEQFALVQACGYAVNAGIDFITFSRWKTATAHVPIASAEFGVERARPSMHHQDVAIKSRLTTRIVENDRDLICA